MLQIRHFPGQQPSSKVDFCARSVIGGDPNLDTEQVGVPRCIWVVMVEMGKVETVCMYLKKKVSWKVTWKIDIHSYGSYVMVYSWNTLMFFVCLFGCLRPLTQRLCSGQNQSCLVTGKHVYMINKHRDNTYLYMHVFESMIYTIHIYIYVYR